MSRQKYVFVVLAFDRLAEAKTFVFIANSSNCISEVSFLLVAQVRDQVLQVLRNSEVHGSSSFYRCNSLAFDRLAEEKTIDAVFIGANSSNCSLQKFPFRSLLNSSPADQLVQSLRQMYLTHGFLQNCP